MTDGQRSSFQRGDRQKYKNGYSRAPRDLNSNVTDKAHPAHNHTLTFWRTRANIEADSMEGNRAVGFAGALRLEAAGRSALLWHGGG
jgi:hypothetical protein